MTKFWSEAAKRCTPYVPGEQLNDPNIIKLNTNENPYPPSPLVVGAIKQEVENQMNRYPSPTLDNVREKIAYHYQVDKENVFIGNGSDEVLAFSFMAFFEEHQQILFPDISYSFYPVYANLFQIPYREMPLKQDFTLDETLFFGSQGGVILPNPNAPTSIHTALDRIQAIIENNNDNVVIIDEAYSDFASDSAVELIKQYKNLLVVKTMSKSRSLAGLRIGYAIGDKELIEGLTRIKDSFNSYTVDRLAIAGAEAAIEDNKYYQETTRKIMNTRNWLLSDLKKRGFKVLPSETNFLFVHHPMFHAESLYKALKENGILVRHFNKLRISNYLRITIGTKESMEQFLGIIDDIFSKK
ncbi:histidinol-phosphate transaminase [Virgibacillus salexigens]|uniref:Histidinol-phosphate aminotransferase n=1 Tax=Virgibacillus kapii TaxID=1638645 RepID=A0ABQ2DTB1_9BACI|nr:histidinol-phosphate transaminase [Virgibacillus kapii]GGJ66841.1 histidinol-phosphate aminotransferase [Virgibacillus kapii]